jgi:hypothetical protein
MANEKDLDFDDVDLSSVDDSELDNVDLSSFGEVEDTVDFPHFKVATKEFKEFLKVAKTICSAGGRDVVSKAVCLSAKDGKLVCRSTDFDVYIEQKLELMNVTNILDGEVVIPTDILIKLIKAVPVNTVIYKNGDNFYIRLYGGDIVLETYSITADKFSFLDEVEKVGTIAAVDLYSVIKDFSGVVTAAVSPQERRILFEKQKAYASYMWAIMMSSKSFQDFDLKIKDISVLKNLLLGSEEVLEVFVTKESVKIKRCVISGTKFKYSFLISDVRMSESMKDNLVSVVDAGGVFVDFISFYKMVEVAADLPYSIGKIGLNYSEDGIHLAIKTKKDKDSVFNITGSKDGEVVSLKDELIVQAKLLKIVLRSFASKSSVRLSVSEKGLGIVSDDYSAAIYSETK